MSKRRLTCYLLGPTPNVPKVRNMPYHIFGKVENQRVTFIGCSRNANIPADSILLQTVEDHPESHWIKWSKRFGWSLEDKTALSHPYASYFKNSARTKRLFGDADYERFAEEQNVQFLRFHERNSHFLELLLKAALQKKADGRREYSVDQLLGEARWSNSEIDRGDDGLKVNGRWSRWYSRVLQMVEPRLIGFFAVRSSTADGLVWIDSLIWQEFASKHHDKIRWDDLFDQSPDSDWEHLG